MNSSTVVKSAFFERDEFGAMYDFISGVADEEKGEPNVGPDQIVDIGSMADKRIELLACYNQTSEDNREKGPERETLCIKGKFRERMALD
jgi:hypothetical protein